MRNAFADELVRLAAKDSKIVLLSGDIGNRLFDKFKKLFPNRFYNCGVAEANMASMATGLAMCGLKPITYTITPFNTTRCLEQIRVDICYNNAPVMIVGVGAGLSYASLGCTHHSCEDISFLRSIPNMTVLCPGDALELRPLMHEALKLNGPVYLRMGKKGEPIIHDEIPDVKIGKGYVLNQGRDICLLSTGNMLPAARDVAQLLEKEDIQAQLVSFHTVKPLDIPLLNSLFSSFPLIVTMEEHSLIGGLGTSIAEWLVDQENISTKLLRIGTPDCFPHQLGSQEYLREIFSLNPSAITEKIIKIWKNLPCEQKQPY